MRVSGQIHCEHFPCFDVRPAVYSVPGLQLDPAAIWMVMVSEAAAADPADNYYARGHPLFQQTTVQAFNDAEVPVSSIRDLVRLGVYLTTAVKCGKAKAGLQPDTIEQCSHLLEKELGLFPQARVLMLMGDVAIRAVNAIARRAGEPRVIPAQATYKLRGQAFYFRGLRVFPSYLQAGPSFFIEKSKRRMIAEDIAAAMQLSPSGRKAVQHDVSH
jgi:hypothetical protein